MQGKGENSNKPLEIKVENQKTALASEESQGDWKVTIVKAVQQTSQQQKVEEKTTEMKKWTEEVPKTKKRVEKENSSFSGMDNTTKCGYRLISEDGLEI